MAVSSSSVDALATDASQEVTSGSGDSSPAPSSHHDGMSQHVGGPTRRQEIVTHALVLVMCSLIALAALVLSVPGTAREETVMVPLINRPLPPLCASKIMLGVECPGCGMTRSFISFAHGDFARAWQFNSVGVLGFVLVLSQIPYRSWQLLRLGRGKPAFAHPALNWPVFGLLGLMGVRMAWMTFLMLAPLLP